MGPLVVHAPIVGHIFRFVISTASKLLNRFRRISAKDFWYAASFIKILFEPLKDAGDFHSVLVRHKTVEIVACQPGAICLIVLLLKFVARIGEALKWRATACSTDQDGMRVITDQRPQCAVFDVIKRYFATPALVRSRAFLISDRTALD